MSRSLRCIQWLRNTTVFCLLSTIRKHLRDCYRQESQFQPQQLKGDSLSFLARPRRVDLSCWPVLERSYARALMPTTHSKSQPDTQRSIFEYTWQHVLQPRNLIMIILFCVTSNHSFKSINWSHDWILKKKFSRISQISQKPLFNFNFHSKIFLDIIKAEFSIKKSSTWLPFIRALNRSVHFWPGA